MAQEDAPAAAAAKAETAAVRVYDAVL